VTNFHAVMIVSSLSAVELLKTRSFAAGVHAQHSAQCSAGDGTTLILIFASHKGPLICITSSFMCDVG